MAHISLGRRAGTLGLRLLPLLLLAGCGAESERFPDNRDPGVYLRVVDASGHPVEGVEIHVISVPTVDLDGATVPVDASTCYGEEN